MQKKEQKILIVDDNPEDRNVLRRHLLKDVESSYTIFEENTGKMSLAWCRSEKPDCILLDYNLPDMNGLEFLAELADTSGSVPFPVVILTGVSLEPIAVQAMKSGAQDYLVKGNITTENLHRAIQNAIERVHMLRTLEAQRYNLEQKNQELQAFAYALAHDLQAPLRAISGFAQIVNEDYQAVLDDAEFVELGRQADLSEAIEQGNYDIVLTDYQLNWTDGLRILCTVKERYPDVPVLMFTGTGSEEVAVEGMKSGLSNYILKKHLDNLPFAVRESLEKAQLQKQYHKAIQQLRESESRYREIFEQGLAGIAVFKPSGQLLTCNAAFAHMFAFVSIDEALKCDICELFASKQAYEEFLASLQHEQRLENYEAELYTYNGEPIYIVGNVVGDFNDDGELIRIKQYIFDNTERKRLEERYRHAQKMESLGQLVSGIAHDFNNMLGGILGHTERSMAKITEKHSLYDNLKHTREITERAAKMTRQLLAFSRRQVLDPKDININDVISELLAFNGIIGQHNGCIDVTSKVGQGTALKMYLPAVDRAPVPIHMEVNVRLYQYTWR